MNEELTNVKEEIETLKMGSSCAVSSAASTGSGLGSTIEIKGWVRDWSLNDVTGFNEEQAKELLTQLEGPCSRK